MDVILLTAMIQNIDQYMKTHNLTHFKWIRVQLIICLRLYEAYPDPIPLTHFIDQLNNKDQIGRGLRDLEDNCGFIRVETQKVVERGNPKLIYLTDKGKEFCTYIDPTGDDK